MYFNRLPRFMWMLFALFRTPIAFIVLLINPKLLLSPKGPENTSLRTDRNPTSKATAYLAIQIIVIHMKETGRGLSGSCSDNDIRAQFFAPRMTGHNWREE